MRNEEVRDTAKKAGVFLWQIAAEMGMNDGNFSRKLRHELPADEKAEIMKIISRLAKGENTDA